MGKIVLAIDDSDHSQRAWDFYNKNVRRADDEVILVHCIEPPFHAAYPVRADVMKEKYDEAKSEGEVVERKFKHLMHENNVNFKLISDFGKPGEFVVDKANENQATMIIMGTRGMGKMRRTILGSVSDYVVHHAHCPVLVARH